MHPEPIKTIENRTWHYPRDAPEWFVVASSRSRPTRSMMEDLYARRGFGPQAREEDNYVYGHILSMVRVEGSYDTPPQPSVWYNPPDKAWVIAESIHFPTPIPLDADDKFQIQVSLGKRPQYQDQIEAALHGMGVPVSSHFLCPNTRIIKVRQPWAQILGGAQRVSGARGES